MLSSNQKIVFELLPEDKSIISRTKLFNECEEFVENEKEFNFIIEDLIKAKLVVSINSGLCLSNQGFELLEKEQRARYEKSKPQNSTYKMTKQKVENQGYHRIRSQFCMHLFQYC